LINSVIPAEYRSARLEDFGDSINQDDIKWNPYGFCFRGDPKIGKTHMATALACEHLRPTHPHTIARLDESGTEPKYIYPSGCFSWITVPTLLARIRSTFNNSGETEFDIIKKMSSTPLMVLDDLGAEAQSDFSSSTLYALISERRNRHRITIVTSNQRLSEINAWNPRITSRLAEMATVRLPSTDRRLTKPVPDALDRPGD